jgi:hypothetical protein
MILEFERGSTRSHFVENSLWQRLWTCRKTEHGVKFTQPHADLLAKGLARNMLVCVCLVSSSLNGYAELEKLGPHEKQLPFKLVC